MKDDSVSSDLLKVIGEINTSLGYEAAASAEDGMLSDVKGFISTGCTTLDISLRGGIPLGRVVEIYGQPSSAKSTLVTHIFAECQKLGMKTVGKPGLCVIVDSETTFSKQRAIRMGLDPSYLLELRASTVEEGFQQVQTTIEKIKDNPDFEDRPVVVAWDTIAAAPTQSESEGKNFAEGMIRKPRIIQEGFRKLGRDFGRNSIAFIIVNQIISGPMGNSTPGGNAIKFYSTQRIMMKKVGEISNSRGIIGTEHEARVVKNKIDGAWLPKDNIATFPQHFDDGIQNVASILNTLAKSPDVKEVSWNRGRYYVDYKGMKYTSWYKDLNEKIISLEGIVDWLKDLAVKNLTMTDFSLKDEEVKEEEKESQQEAIS